MTRVRTLRVVAQLLASLVAAVMPSSRTQTPWSYVLLPMYRLLICAVTSVAVLACASSGGTGSRSSCALTQQDSTHLTRGMVYRDCSVDATAKLLNEATVRPDFRLPTGAVRSTCYEAELELVVDARGMPEPGTPRIVTSSDRTFADAVLAVLPNYRYEPARKDGLAVRQIVREKRKMAVAVMPVSGGSRTSAPRC